MRSDSRALRWSFVVGLLALAIGSSLPIWTVRGRYTPEELDKGYTKPFFEQLPLWAALAHVGDMAKDVRHRRQNVACTGILFGVTAAIGFGAYRILSPRERSTAVKDYAESPDGALPDRGD